MNRVPAKRPTGVRDVALLAAGTVGALSAALLTGACIARFAPLGDDLRFLLGFVGVIPLWLTSSMLAFRARNGVHALLGCAAASAALGAALWLAP
ncbi:MAG: hypothetical protein ABW252_15505 [Polyangiales bacterium]